MATKKKPAKKPSLLNRIKTPAGKCCFVCGRSVSEKARKVDDYHRIFCAKCSKTKQFNHPKKLESKKPPAKPKKGPAPALSPEQIINICVRWLSGEDRQVLADDYGVHVNTIAAAIKRAGLKKKDKKAPAEDPKLVKKNLSAYARVPTGHPDKPLDQIAWLYGTLIVSAQVVASEDFGGNEKERRKELLSHATVITKLIPPASLKAAKDKLTEDSKDMDDGIGPGMESVGD